MIQTYNAVPYSSIALMGLSKPTLKQISIVKAAIISFICVSTIAHLLYIRINKEQQTAQKFCPNFFYSYC